MIFSDIIFFVYKIDILKYEIKISMKEFDSIIDHEKEKKINQN